MHRQTGMHANAKRQPPLQLPTADGKFMIAVMQNFGARVWDSLIKWMDEKGVAGELHDPKYQDEAYRTSEYRTGTVVRDAIARLIAASNGEECFHRAQSYGISWGLVHAAEENYDIPHYKQRGYWRSIDQPEIGRAIPFPRGPFSCDALGIEARGRAPHLGEHTEHILAKDLGLSAEAIEALRASGAIR
jgi:crotonobetainyl-CoA:carnitine CoA-transferase CaiB-like acyl-CoA transferase